MINEQWSLFLRINKKNCKKLPAMHAKLLDFNKFVRDKRIRHPMKISPKSVLWFERSQNGIKVVGLLLSNLLQMVCFQLNKLLVKHDI